MKQEQLKELYQTRIEPIIRFDGEFYKLNSKYKIGTAHIHNNHAILKQKNREAQKLFIDFADLDGAHDGDKVIVKVIFHPKGKTKAKVVKVLNKTYKPIVAIFHKNENIFKTIKEDIVLKINIHNKNIKDGDVYIIQDDKLLEFFGNISDPKVDEKISLYLYNEFDRLNDTSTKEFNTTIDQFRVDLSNLNFTTIDPYGAKDHDDAIYYDSQNHELYVAIADVSAYVLENSQLDHEARKKSFSIYLPNKVLPMLPFELSSDLCSLVPNEKRAAYVFKIKLDTDNQTVVSSTLFEAFIVSKRRYTYDEIDTILENKSDGYFNDFWDIALKFRNKRLKNGYDFRSEEIRLVLDKNHNLVDQKFEHSSASHSLVEECMLLANQEAAKKLGNIGIFRVHDEPSASKIYELVEQVNALGIKVKLKDNVHNTILNIQQKATNANLEKEVDDLIIKAQQQAFYSSKKSKHFGLGFDDYSHFTSPIRRYSDLVLHRILKTEKIPKDIDDICEDISNQEREIAKLVWDYEDRKYARWAQEHIHDIFEAIITDRSMGHAKIDDEKIKGIKVTLEKYNGEKLFSKIKVKIVKSDIVTKKIIAKVV